MSKIYILKPDAQIKYAIIYGKQTTCYLSSDCVPVDIDETPLLTDDEIDAIAEVTPVDNNALRRAICKAQIHKVGEYLQERIGE